MKSFSSEDLASVSCFEDIRLRFMPKEKKDSDPQGVNKELFEMVTPILQFYDSLHRGPPVPKAVRYLDLQHVTTLTITVSEQP